MNIPRPATTSLQVDEEMQLQLEQELADWGAPATRDGIPGLVYVYSVWTGKWP